MMHPDHVRRDAQPPRRAPPKPPWPSRPSAVSRLTLSHLLTTIINIIKRQKTFWDANAVLHTRFCHSLGQGIVMRLLECNAEKDLRLHFNVPRDNVGCSFCLEGAMRTRIKELRLDTTVSSGTSGLWFVPGASLCAAIPAGRTRWLDLEIHYERFREFLAEHACDICPELRLSLERRATDTPFRRCAPMTLQTRLLLEQILACPFKGSLKTVFLECKGLDLLLGEIIRHAFIHRAPGRTGCPNRAKVEKAKSLLLDNIATPLTISALSSQVGMSESSLKRAFHDIHGVSIFTFFQTRRLEQARALLVRGDMNVTEVAFSVGYSNHSHFSRAFKRQYGESPRQCQAKACPVLALPLSMT